MPRLTRDQWDELRAKREAGYSFDELAKTVDCSKNAIVQMAKREKWGDGTDAKKAIIRRANEKVGNIPTGDAQKKAAAIELEADKLAEIQRRHRDEPNAVRASLYDGMRALKAAASLQEKNLATADIRAAKAASEAMLNIHKAERQAWGMDADLDVKTLSIEQLEALAKGRPV